MYKKNRGRPPSPRIPATYKMLPEHREWLRDSAELLGVSQSELLGECIEYVRGQENRAATQSALVYPSDARRC